MLENLTTLLNYGQQIVKNFENECLSEKYF